VPSHFSGTETGAKLSNRGCFPVSFSIQATGVITGKVLDTRGQPRANLTVSIFSAEGVTNEVLERLEPYYEQRDTTDKQGQFRFSKLPSGRYLIAVNLVKQYDQSSSGYPRIFYPGVLNLSEAGIITLSDGEQKQNIELKLPPM
jgi:5-hydroxyisourate hydrolase-like protein (transthyretin family)